MSDEQPIIIKKIVKGHGGHHGGAWKIAYADFVTAMMAFFLLMWLLNATTEDQRMGLADFFSPTPGAMQSTTGGEGIGSGQSVVTEGVFTEDKASPGVMVMIDPVEAEEVTEEEAEEVIAEREEEQFEEAEDAIREAMEETPELKELANNLIIDQTPEGLRIQIVDREGSAMFRRGSTSLTPKAKTIIEQVVRAIAAMSNKLTITGNTDASQFARYGYDNWDLSTDRANSSRRAMLHSGLDKERIFRVTGRASEDLLDKEDPTATINRRISIVLLRDSYLKKFEEVEEIEAGGLEVAPVEAPPGDETGVEAGDVPQDDSMPIETEPETMPLESEPGAMEAAPQDEAAPILEEEAVPESETFEAAPQDEAEPEAEIKFNATPESATESTLESATEPEAESGSSLGDFFQNLMPDSEKKPQIQIDLN